MIQQDVYEVVLREGMDGVDGYQQRVNERFLSEGVVFGKFNWADVRGTTESPAQDIAEVDTPSNARLTGEELEGIHQDEEEEHPLHLMNKHPLHVKSMMEETPAPTEVAQLALAHIDIEQPGVATAGPDGNCLAQIDIAMDCKPLDGPAQAKPASKRRKGGSRKKSQVKPDCVPLNIVPSSASKKRIVESKKDCIVGKDIKTVLQNTYHPYLTQQIYDLSCGTGLSLRYAIGYRGQSSEKRKVLEVDGKLCEYAILTVVMAINTIKSLKNPKGIAQGGNAMTQQSEVHQFVESPAAVVSFQGLPQSVEKETGQERTVESVSLPQEQVHPHDDDSMLECALQLPIRLQDPPDGYHTTPLSIMHNAFHDNSETTLSFELKQRGDQLTPDVASPISAPAKIYQHNPYCLGPPMIELTATIALQGENSPLVEDSIRNLMNQSGGVTIVEENQLLGVNQSGATSSNYYEPYKAWKESKKKDKSERMVESASLPQEQVFTRENLRSTVASTRGVEAATQSSLGISVVALLIFRPVVSLYWTWRGKDHSPYFGTCFDPAIKPLPEQ